jgi:methyl acetate hydrolase
VLTGYDEAGKPQLRAPLTPVTLRNLLTHSSGFVYEIWNAELQTYVSRTNIPSLFSGLKAALEVPLMFDPGSRWEYGIGIDWVGQMVEAISGQTLGQYCGQHIFKPLKMLDSGFKPTAAMLGRMTKTLYRNAEGVLIEPPPPAAEAGPPADFEGGGGGLLSTVRDYSRFLQMILRGGELDGVRVLETETVQLMAQNQMGDLRVVSLISSAPQLSVDAEFFPGEEKSWGLTFQISETACATGRQAGTLMWAGLTNCFFWIDHKSDLTGIFLTQVLPFGDPLSLQAFYEFESEAYNQFA